MKRSTSQDLNAPLISPELIDNEKKTNYRWLICFFLFLATLIIYFDRQILSLTYNSTLKGEFHWSSSTYGWITGLFSIFYAVSMFFAGKIIDKLGTLRGYVLTIGIWLFGAAIHSLIGVFTLAFFDGRWVWNFKQNHNILEAIKEDKEVQKVEKTSLVLFIICRFILAVGESGNFPVAIRAVGEYFPKKDRGFATAIFNTGATIGALVAPLIIPLIVGLLGWEVCFLGIAGIGLIWIFFWCFVYKKPNSNKHMNREEIDYINQDAVTVEQSSTIPLRKCLLFKQTWQFAFGKFMTDGIWWFFLFWTPAYLENTFDTGNDGSQVHVSVIYAITTLAIVVGYLPTYFINNKNMIPYDGRMFSLLIFAFIPFVAIAMLVSALQLPYLQNTPWIPVVLVGIVGTAHQSWSANLFSTIGDMFPKGAIATVTGIGGMAGGIGSFLVNLGSGYLFDYAERTDMKLMTFTGAESGYCIVFLVSAFAYLIAWTVMKILVPAYSPIQVFDPNQQTEQMDFTLSSQSKNN